MSQTTKQGDLGLITEHSGRLESLRAERVSLDDSIYAELDGAEQLYSRLDLDSAQELVDETKKGQSRIDQALTKYGGYKASVADLAAGFVNVLDSYVDFARHSQQYQGAESVFAFLPFSRARARANRMRIERLRTQSPRENLKAILDYGRELYTELCEVRERGQVTLSQLETQVQLVTGKIAEYEPRVATLKECLGVIDTEFKKLDEQFGIASPAEQAAMVETLNAKREELTRADNAYRQAFAVYKQAQDSLEANIQSRDAFSRMVLDLGDQATHTKEKLDNVAQVYAAAPVAIEIMLRAKGAESVHETVNAATTRSVDMITQAADGVSDVTLKIKEALVIAEKDMREFMNRMDGIQADYTQRSEKIERDARRSRDERYGGDTPSTP